MKVKRLLEGKTVRTVVGPRNIPSAHGSVLEKKAGFVRAAERGELGCCYASKA